MKFIEILGTFQDFLKDKSITIEVEQETPSFENILKVPKILKQN